MKQFLFMAVALFVAAACSTTSTSIETVDSVTVALDTVTIEEVLKDSLDGKIEMVSTELEFETVMPGPQFSPTIAYNYCKTGLPVYAEIPAQDDAALAVGRLAFGERIELVKELVNSKPNDKVIIDGLKGRYIEVKREGGLINYVFSGYLTNLKVPELQNPDNLSFDDYFVRNFVQQTRPVKKTPRDTSEEESRYTYEVDYVLEGDMHVWTHGYYEGDGASVTLPKNATIQDAWLILTSLGLHERFKTSFPTFPTEERNETVFEINRTLLVEKLNGQVNKIYVMDTGGCIDEIGIVAEDGRVKIVRDGGC